MFSFQPPFHHFNLVAPSRAKGKRRRARPRVAEILESRHLLSAVTNDTSDTADYAKAAMTFQPNVGQAAAQVNYISQAQGYSVDLMPNEAVISLSQSVSSASGQTTPNSATLSMRLVGANVSAQATGLDLQAGKTNYITGNDPSQWHTNISNFGRVQYQDVYSGIDVVYYGNQRQLEYDFNLAPGADANAIDLAFSGDESASVDAQGDLVLATSSGDVLQYAPVVYQQTAVGRQAVSGRYDIHADGSVGFTIGAYDKTLPLTIDPTLSYSTYLGGSGADQGNGIAVDAAGNAYVTGSTSSADFPTRNSSQSASGGGDSDVFVAKFDASGALVYSTYFGGSDADHGSGIAVDASGDAYVTGETASTNLPTKNAIQTTLKGGHNAFVAKFDVTGALVYSTYLGGSGTDDSRGIAVDSSGNAYVTGETSSSDFPTKNAHQATFNGGGASNPSAKNAFLAKLDSSGALVYSTFLGGSSGGDDEANAVAVDGSGNAYITGSNSRLPKTGVI